MKNKKLCAAGIVLGSILTLGPMWGLLFTVLGMIHSFDVLGASGISDPRALAHSIGLTLIGTATGLFVFPIGLILLIVSSICLSQRRAVSIP